MKILFYATQSDQDAENLQKILETLVLKDQLEIYRTFHNFSNRLCQPRNSQNIAVLTVTNGKELHEILSIRNLLSDIRIILVLPDGKPDTISKAHMLGPRFLTYLDSDFEEVKSVLNKMLENRHSKGI